MPGGYGEGTDLDIITGTYEAMMQLLGAKVFEYGQTLARAQHSVGAYTDRQRKELEERVSAAAQLCDRYGFASDSPDMLALTDAYRAMIAMTEASAYAQGVAWGINEKKPPTSR